ncbi:MAG: glycosyltransferase family 39 protein [Chryseolinea sp.]
MPDKEIVSRYAGDIRIWIGLFFLLHLSTITLPPLEPASTWRQTDGLMVARNFYEVDNNIMYPRVDVGGNLSGIVGCEFPFLNYLIYLLSLVFGYEHWYGRLINLIVSSVGVYVLYRLIKEYIDEKTALLTGVIVLCSQWFTYSRTNVPDTFCTSLCLIALYYGVRFLYDGGYWRLAIYLILGWLGCMNKISIAAILTVMAIPFFQKSVALDRKVWIALSSALIIVSTFAWYFIWVPHLNDTFGFHGHFFMGMGLVEGTLQIIDLWQPSLKRFVVTPFKYSGFILFLFGLFTMFKNKMRLRLIAFALPFFAYLVVVLKTGFGFQLNPYYVVAFIPPMAFVIATGLSSIQKQWITLILMLAIAGEGIGNQIHTFTIREPGKSMTGIEAVLDQHTKRSDLIAINGTTGGDPTPMYFAHRKGLAIANSDLSDPSYKERFSKNGIKYIVILPQMYGDATPDLPLVVDTGYVRIYRLE